MRRLFSPVAMASNFFATILWWAPVINSGHTFRTYFKKSSRHPSTSPICAKRSSSFNRRSEISGVSARSIGDPFPELFHVKHYLNRLNFAKITYPLTDMFFHRIVSKKQGRSRRLSPPWVQIRDFWRFSAVFGA